MPTEFSLKTYPNRIANAPVKSSILKKLKIEKTGSYPAAYLKDTVKKTVKVKK